MPEIVHEPTREQIELFNAVFEKDADGNYTGEANKALGQVNSCEIPSGSDKIVSRTALEIFLRIAQISIDEGYSKRDERGNILPVGGTPLPTSVERTISLGSLSENTFGKHIIISDSMIGGSCFDQATVLGGSVVMGSFLALARVQRSFANGSSLTSTVDILDGSSVNGVLVSNASTLVSTRMDGGGATKSRISSSELTDSGVTESIIDDSKVIGVPISNEELTSVIVQKVSSSQTGRITKRVSPRK